MSRLVAKCVLVTGSVAFSSSAAHADDAKASTMTRTAAITRAGGAVSHKPGAKQQSASKSGASRKSQFYDLVLSVDGELVGFLDRASIERSPSGVATFNWEVVTNGSQLRTEGFKVGRYRYALDCARKTITTLESTTFNDQLRPVSHATKTSPPAAVRPQTNDGVLYDAVCGGNWRNLYELQEGDADANTRVSIADATYFMASERRNAAPNSPQPPTTPPPTSGRANGPSTTLTINASVRVPGPGRVFVPVSNTPVYLSSRDLEQTLASAGLARPTPVDAWLQACRAHTPACQRGMEAVRGVSPAARGLTDGQGHFTFNHAPVGHFFVVAIGDITPGHTLIWCVPIDIHAGDNELTLAGHNLYVSQQ